MAFPEVKTAFNEYELALLAAAALRVRAGEVSVKDAARALSARYRAAARRRVKVLRGSYRSESGVSTNLRAMLRLLSGFESGWVVSRGELFVQVADMAQDDADAFSELLSKAEEYYPAVSLPDSSRPKGGSVSHPRRPRRPRRPAPAPVRPATESSLFAEDAALDGRRVRDVLARSFPEGYLQGSYMHWKKFIGQYGTSDEGFTERQAVWERAIAPHAVVVSEGDTVRYYAPESLMPDPLRRRVYNHICELLSTGQPAVYYARLMDHFAEAFDATAIHGRRGRLEAYLRTMYDREWSFREAYLTGDERVVVDEESEVVGVMRSAGCPLSKEDVVRRLSWIPRDRVERAFMRCPELVACGRHTRCHVSLVSLSDDERASICRLISAAIARDGYCSRSSLLCELRASVPSVMAHSAVVGDRGLDNALSVLLGEEYVFTPTTICAKGGAVIETKDIIIGYARDHATFTWDGIDAVAKTLGDVYLNYYLWDVYRYAIRVDDVTFVRLSSLEVDISAVDAALDALFGDAKVLPLRAIDNFVCFPVLPYRWSTRLLEGLLTARDDSRYKYVAQQYIPRTGCYGAVVRRAACAGWTYDDVLAHALATSGLSLSERDLSAAGVYLHEQGYLSKSQYRRLREVLVLAERLRQ